MPAKCAYYSFWIRAYVLQTKESFMYRACLSSSASILSSIKPFEIYIIKGRVLLWNKSKVIRNSSPFDVVWICYSTRISDELYYFIVRKNNCWFPLLKLFNNHNNWRLVASVASPLWGRFEALRSLTLGYWNQLCLFSSFCLSFLFLLPVV